MDAVDTGHRVEGSGTHKSSIEVSACERYGGGEFWRPLLLVDDRTGLGFGASAMMMVGLVLACAAARALQR